MSRSCLLLTLGRNVGFPAFSLLGTSLTFSLPGSDPKGLPGPLTMGDGLGEGWSVVRWEDGAGRMKQGRAAWLAMAW